MDFPTWLKTQPRGTALRIVRDARVGMTTLQRCMKRIPAGPGVALRISAATGGEVTPEELSFPPAPPDGESAPNSELEAAS